MITGRDDSHHHIGGLTEKCGAVGVTLGGRDVARSLYHSLYALQHRDQESAGTVTHDGFQQHNHVQMGPVGDAFGTDDLDGLKGETGIGYVCYPTAGDVSRSCAQPFAIPSRSGSFDLAHNGNLINADRLCDELENFGHAFTSVGDIEVIAHDPARNLLEEDLVRAVKRTMEHIHGSYALTIIHDEAALGACDPERNRLPCIRRIDDGYVLASESAAIDTLDGELVRNVKPGEPVALEPDGSGFDPYQLVERDNTARCFFEHIYFARPDSVMNDTLVYEARRGFGRKLWDESGVDTDVIMPVPDSGRVFASGYAEAAQEDDVVAELAEGLMRNRYVGRMFIMPTQDERGRTARLKLNPIKSIVEGKSVTLTDDSIVRGAISNQLAQLLYDAGATEVHTRIGALPIVAPCYMGINMATREELIASDESVGEVRDTIDADSLGYLSTDSAAEVLGKSQSDLCPSCVTGEYPYDINGEETDCDVSRPAVGAKASLND